jgi:hypothetical protein
MQHLLGRLALSPWGIRPGNGAAGTLGANVLEFFDVPTGAFPIPWGPDCHDPTGCERTLMGRLPEDPRFPTRPLGLFL